MNAQQNTQDAPEAVNNEAAATKKSPASQQPPQPVDRQAPLRYALLLIIALMLTALTSYTLDTIRVTEANMKQIHANLLALPW